MSSSPTGSSSTVSSSPTVSSPTVSSPTVSSSGEPTVRVAVGLAVAGAVGCAVLAVAHAGVEIPGVSALGPGGSRPVWPAAAAFAVGVGAYATVAAGLRAGASWSWWAAEALFAATVVAALRPFRGVGSVAGALLGLAGAALLALPSARRRLRSPTS